MQKHGLEAENLEIEVDGDTVKVAGATESSSLREKIVLALGNTLGISKVEENIEVKNEEPEATFYTVQKRRHSLGDFFRALWQWLKI